MTYNAYETSHQSGAPVELYEFARAAQVWRYTSADSDITYDSKTWSAATMMRNSIEATPEQARNALKVTVQRDNEVADLFRQTAPTEVIALTVRRYHRGDGNAVVIWVGRVLNVEWQGSQAVLNCEPVTASMKRPGLRRLYQRQCPHVLYSAACGVNKAAMAVAGTVGGISGTALTVAAAAGEADGYFAGGYVEWQPESGVFERRFIKKHIGSALTLSVAFDGIAVGQAVTLYPGCDHTTTTCDGKFSNLNNYGGFPHIPTKNPFGGSPIF
jgi:uncharacterized phage protein (TIGR02218 family)